MRGQGYRRVHLLAPDKSGMESFIRTDNHQQWIADQPVTLCPCGAQVFGSWTVRPSADQQKFSPETSWRSSRRSVRRFTNRAGDTPASAPIAQTVAANGICRINLRNGLVDTCGWLLTSLRGLSGLPRLKALPLTESQAAGGRWRPENNQGICITAKNQYV